MAFLSGSDNQKKEWRSGDIEVLENYLTLPYGNSQTDSERSLYYSSPTQYAGQYTNALKDSETNGVIETLLAKCLLGTIGKRGFCQAVSVGREDAFAGDVVSRLIQRTYRLRGNFRAKYTQMKDAFLWGAGVNAPSWIFRETMSWKKISMIDPWTGERMYDWQLLPVTMQDDVALLNVDIDDFFPDPGNDEIRTMLGAARRYFIPAYRAFELAEETGPGGERRWDPDAVDRAVMSGPSDKSSKEDYWRAAKDRPTNRFMLDDYRPLVAYEWWGETPYLHEDGVRRRRITVLNNELVESTPSPVRFTQTVPFYDMVVNPIQGRWRGVSPGQIMRFTQSFLDAMLICLADAAIRKANPPIIYDYNDQELDVQSLEDFRGPIKAGSVKSVSAIDYNPNMQEGFQTYYGVKEIARQQTGASSALQEGSLGSKRFSASESRMAMKQIIDRPQVIMELFERESYPAESHATLNLYQDNLMGDEELARRIGESNMHLGRRPSLEDIEGDFDVEFVGSSMFESDEMKLEAIERAMQTAASIPGAAAMFPWAPVFVEQLETMGLKKIAALVADPNGVEDYVMQMMAQQGGQGGGAAPGASMPSLSPGGPAGLQPAQAAGQSMGPQSGQ